MPWKTSSLLEARQRLVGSALRGCKSVAQLCSEFGISQKTGFKWLNRFRCLGGPGLHDLSRRPQHSPRRTAARWIEAIAQIRRQHPTWGAKKIYARLRQQHPRARLPKRRTITECLKRLGLTRRRRIRSHRGPKVPRVKLTIPKRPNDVWTVDFKGWFRTRNGQRVDPLTVRDLFSRFILGVGLLRYQHEPVRQYLQRLFIRYGQPTIIRVDHGSPFASEGALDLSRLSVWWLRLGIQVEFTGRGCPQDNGAHEQMHRVYKAEVAWPAAATPRAQQWRTTRWIHYYNYDRPHEALEQQVPASRYRKSRQPFRAPRHDIRYPRHWRTSRVTASGRIRWRGRLRVIGRAFGGERVGFKPVSASAHKVYFMRHLIGELFDTDLGGMRPARWSKAQETPPPS
jgi:transposase InsO family protein